jgi:hypothetical protein
MSQHYSDPTRESDPHALPDVETFYMSPSELAQWARSCGYTLEAGAVLDADGEPIDAPTYTSPGWYWWPCFPGCLPESEPCGPFATEDLALEDMRQNMDYGDTSDNGELFD